MSKKDGVPITIDTITMPSASLEDNAHRKKGERGTKRMSDYFNRLDGIVAGAIALLIAAWIIAFAGFWIWGVLS